MFLIDFTDHRIIGIIIGASIAVISLTAILIHFLVREHKRKKEATTESKLPEEE